MLITVLTSQIPLKIYQGLAAQGCGKLVISWVFFEKTTRAMKLHTPSPERTEHFKPVLSKTINKNRDTHYITMTITVSKVNCSFRWRFHQLKQDGSGSFFHAIICGFYDTIISLKWIIKWVYEEVA